MEGRTQVDAAMLAEMSVRSARRWQSGGLPSEAKERRTYRTRKDPFEDVWDDWIVPRLKADEERKLQGTAVLDALVAEYPGRFCDGHLRTLQRRISDWRALHGPDQEVMFEQEHPPGREGAFDFTHCTELGVTIGGEVLRHLLFVFTLSCSRWTHVSLAFGETFEALLSGLQEALWTLGGVPAVVRHDNLSAATRELKDAGRSLTKKFQAVADHYGVESTRISPGKSNENGGVEQTNHRVKETLEQELILRGSREFASTDAYMDWVRSVIERKRNGPKAARLTDERPHLRPLPARPLPSYTEWRPTVRKWSTIRIGKTAYSVPSRLIGHEVTVHLYADHVEVFYKQRLTAAFPRVHGATTRIDYRHVIWSLARKPGAFARYRFREELFPSLVFRRAYDALVSWRGERADVEYVRILHLAAATMEVEVEAVLALLLESGQHFDYAAVRELAEPRDRAALPVIDIGEPDPARYDAVLRDAGGLR